MVFGLDREKALGQFFDELSWRTGMVLPTRKAAPRKNSPEIGNKVVVPPIWKKHVSTSVGQAHTIIITTGGRLVKIIRSQHVGVYNVVHLAYILLLQDVSGSAL